MNPGDHSVPMPAPAGPPGEVASGEQRQLLIDARETRNLIVLGAHYIILRLAWIFKTESVIMPAFLDTIAGAGWLRGCLPVLNRLGQSLPPTLFADKLRDTPQKKWRLLTTSLGMSVPFLTLSVIWLSLDEKRQPWMPAVFLVCYSLFFAVTGLNQLVFGTLQGKLVRPNRRGRLLGVSGIVGSVISVACGWFLLQYWLGLPDGGFGYIFAFCGIGFAVAGVSAVALAEPPDESTPVHSSAKSHFRAAWHVYRDDRQFRRAARVCMLFITIQLLFPHYQALGRQHLSPGSQGFHLMLWVISQNAAVGVFSVLSGWMADRFGNRLAIRLQIFATAFTPVLALYLTERAQSGAGNQFWLAFCLLGLTPVTMKTIVNYTLELAEPADHPRYVSTMSLCMAIPFIFSPLVGLLVDILGFESVFLCISGLIVISGILTFRMSEPRHLLVEPAHQLPADDSTMV